MVRVLLTRTPVTASKPVVRLAASATSIMAARLRPARCSRLSARSRSRPTSLALGGDLTDYGLADEARSLAREITAGLKIPVVAVLGNHDYESGQHADIVKILSDAGVVLLDGDSTEIQGVG